MGEFSSSVDYTLTTQEADEAYRFNAAALDAQVQGVEVVIREERISNRHVESIRGAARVKLERCSWDKETMNAVFESFGEVLEELTITSCYLGRVDSIKPFIDALARCSALKKLSLPQNRLNDSHISQLSSVFPNLQSCETLDLEGNQLEICPCLDSFRSLKDLNLKNNRLNSEAWHEVITQCRRLNVNHIRVWRVDVDLEMLGILKNIASASLECCELLDVQFPVDTGLSELDLDYCKRLCVRNVQALNLPADPVTGLVHLDLSYCGIQLDLIGEKLRGQLFSAIHTLEVLILSGNFCTLVSIPTLCNSISRLEVLRCLELASLCTATVDFISLLDNLTSSSVKELDISGNLQQADSSQAVHISLSSTLRRCPRLLKLNLADNHLESLVNFGNHLDGLEAINLERTEIGKRDLEYLGNCRKLRTFNLGCLDLDNPPNFQPLLASVCTKTQRLLLPNINPSAFAFSLLISSAATLVELDLSGTRLTDSLAASLFDNLKESLEVLNLAYTDWGDTGCELISRFEWKLEKLRGLNLACCSISDVGMRTLMSVWNRLSNIRVFSLSGNRILGESFSDIPLQPDSHLTSIDLRKNPLTLLFPKANFPCLLEVLSDQST